MTPERWAQVERVCHDALAQAPEARAAFLDAACRDDAALRAEVESLLAEQDAAETFLARPVLAGWARCSARGTRSSSARGR